MQSAKHSRNRRTDKGTSSTRKLTKVSNLRQYVYREDTQTRIAQFFSATQIHSKGVQLTPRRSVGFQFCVTTRYDTVNFSTERQFWSKEATFVWSPTQISVIWKSRKKKKDHQKEENKSYVLLVPKRAFWESATFSSGFLHDDK